METPMPPVNGFQLNPLDIATVAAFILCVYAGYRKGLIRMVFNLVSYMLSFYITSRLYPIVSIFLRERSNIYDMLKMRIIKAFAIDELVAESIRQGEEAVISSLPLPEGILRMMEESNIPSVYELLNAATLEDYIGSFLANMCLNILSAMIIFLLVSLIMRLIIQALDLISRLPVIRKFNKAGGVVAGILTGFIAVWVLVSLYCLLFVGINPSNGEILNASYIGRLFYEHGLLLKGFTYVFQ